MCPVCPMSSLCPFAHFVPHVSSAPCMLFMPSVPPFCVLCALCALCTTCAHLFAPAAAGPLVLPVLPVPPEPSALSVPPCTLCTLCALCTPCALGALCVNSVPPVCDRRAAPFVATPNNGEERRRPPPSESTCPVPYPELRSPSRVPLLIFSPSITPSLLPALFFLLRSFSLTPPSYVGRTSSSIAGWRSRYAEERLLLIGIRRSSLILHSWVAKPLRRGAAPRHRSTWEERRRA